jgi:purine-nucleoside phosphorylase
VTHPNAASADTATALADVIGVGRHDVALMLGSGWLAGRRPSKHLSEPTTEISTADLPALAAHTTRTSGGLLNLRSSATCGCW